jgi:predicted dienelactone hydrolase
VPAAVVALALVAAGLVAFSVINYRGAKSDQFPVGFALRTLTYSLPDGSPRTLTIDIWYPSRQRGEASPTDAGSQASTKVAANNDSPRSLVVFSHGNGASPFNYSSILSYFASQGYVVAAPEHQDCVTNCSQAQYAAELVWRPLDARSTLDHLVSLSTSQDEVLHNLIDPSRAASYRNAELSAGGSAPTWQPRSGPLFSRLR